MTQELEDLRSRLPLLEKPRAESGLDADDAQRLVAYGATAWSDWWASNALNWVDEGVWSEEIADALRLCAENQTYSQQTRHRAWQFVKPKPSAST